MEKILLLAENTGIGGINTYLMLLVDGFKTRRVPFGIAAVWPKPDNWLQVQCASHSVPLNMLASRRSITQLPSAIACLTRLIREKEFTIIHSQGYYSNLMARAAYLLSGRHVKLVVTSHGLLPDNAPLGVKLFVLLDWWTFNWSTAIIANSQNTFHRLAEKGVRPEKMQVVLHGVVNQAQINIAPQVPNSIREDDSRPLVIGFVARLSQEKGCVYLLEAMAWLREKGYNLQLLIVGDGPERRSLEKKVAQLDLGDKVTFVGWQACAAKYYCQMDVVVIPSLLESLGLTALEGMSYGKPVVATQVGGVPEIVRHGETGLLVSPASSIELALAIERLLKDPDLRARLGHQSQRYVFEHHTIEKMVKNTLALYRDIRS